MTTPSSQSSLQRSIETAIPSARLEWYNLGSLGLRALLLERESAEKPLSPEQAQFVMDSPPFWSILWPSGERLCRMLSAAPQLLLERDVVDMGAGSGLIACATKLAGAKRVRAVDIDSFSLEVTRLHASANEIELEISKDWPDWPCQTLLLTDFLYDESHLPLLETWLGRSEEIFVIDSRLKALPDHGFIHLGYDTGAAIPDLDPHREFGFLNFWYRGSRPEDWAWAIQKTQTRPV